MNSPSFCIAVHGGAGTILRNDLTAEKEATYRMGLKNALFAGNIILENGGSSLDAVEAVVKSLEDFPLFNAGRGSVFSHDGLQEMDASIMDGKNLSAGSVCNVRNIKNPVSLARKVMEKTQHVMLSGMGAMEFAKNISMELMPDEYFFSEERFNQWQKRKNETTAHLDHNVSFKEKKFGTVGAVALDKNGNLAAATSTGGMTNKHAGRVGDTPIIGSGTYANNKTCAVSCTGDGEFFMRAVVAYDISCLMEYKNFSLQQACNYVVMDKLKKMGGEGGLIALDKKGNIEMPFNSAGMYRGMKKPGEDFIVKIYSN
jgi:L-asparaginase / beta-aspartyl-peptidase